MKSQYNYFEAADFIGTRKQCLEFLESIPEKDFDPWVVGYVVVQKSPRRFAIFSGRSINLIPLWENQTNARWFIKSDKPSIQT